MKARPLFVHDVASEVWFIRIFPVPFRNVECDMELEAFDMVFVCH